MNRRELKRVKKKRKRPIIRRLLFFTLLLLIGIGSYVGYLFYQTIEAANESYNEVENRDGKSKLREKAVNISKDPFSVLLLGVENYSSGDSSRGRSDTLMIATFNPADASMKLLSIPRDSRVKIAGREKKDKINHAYAYGGKEKTIETVENLLDIPVDYYATINFEAFVNIIDILDGVTVDVPFDFWDYKNGDWDTKFYFTEGEMTLNGEEALTYARMRKRDPMGDLGRNERQKQIVEAVIDKVNNPSSLLKLDDITDEIGKNVETNLKVSYLLALQDKYSSFSSKNIESIELEGTSEYINSVSYYIPDEDSLEEVSNTLKAHLEHGEYSDTNSTTNQESTSSDINEEGEIQ